MSVISAQPPPYGLLQREKHIESLCHIIRRPPEGTQGHKACSEEKKQDDQGQAEDDGLQGCCANTENDAQSFMLLENVEQLCITARPHLQGPNCEPGRLYSINTGAGVQLYTAAEDTSCLCLAACGPARSCTIRGYNLQAEPAFVFERPLRADACCFGCCLMEMKVFNSNHSPLGSVQQRWSMFTPLLEIKDPDGTLPLHIQGPCCPARCFASQEFEVVSKIGEKVGKIWKKWPGFNEDYNMDHEYFGMDVPAQMSPKMKIKLLAATFLLNQMFFEMS
ncbi:phospholipid scramblase 2 [Polypterus senegalus]|uniref:phospholipid scramblase 2 n=1 Tax=Polypterus senegalus TaxID=55291 RepID=UPI001963A39A|nr:phospholipid scramblase 2 [Polypterus senegalus]XP_039621420.1 phospholipid scramblase 2 [Polypterus senegalus]